MASIDSAALRLSWTADGGFVVEGVEGGALRARPHAAGGFTLEAGGRPCGTLDRAPGSAPGWILRGGGSGDEERGRTTRGADPGAGLPAFLLLFDGRCFRLEMVWRERPEIRLLGLEGPGDYLRAWVEGTAWRALWTPAGLGLRHEPELVALVAVELAGRGPGAREEGPETA